jgi:putative transposase
LSGKNKKRNKMIVLKAYKYRLYPSKEQRKKLQWTLDRTRELYNASLQERRDAYRMCGVSIRYNQQAAQLPEIKEIRPEYRDIHSQVLQDILRRVDKAFQAFFRRVKAGEKPGYPRFQGKGRFDSFCYPQSGFSLTQENRLCLSKIGTLKVKMHRPLEGNMKTCAIKKEGEHWYVILVCERETEVVYHPSQEAVGIDLGLFHFATLSDGSTIENPRHFRKAEQRLVALQQSLSKKKRGSNRRKKAAKRVGKAHRKIANQRRDFHHKEARNLVDHFAVIVFEKLQASNMSKRPKPKQDEETGQYLPNGAAAKSGLNKSIADAGWGAFVTICESKAACAGSRIVKVSPKYTSQMCSGCRAVVKKDLSERWHSCDCGTELDRDHNASLNILRLGFATLA